MQPNLPNKKQVMDALLSQAPSVFVHLDPRREKVVVPPQFRKQPMLVLEIGMNMRVPIPDLELDEEGIGCTLSFGGRPYWCRMPWQAVFALVTSEQRGMVWPPDVPAEVADRFAPPPAAQQPKPKPAKPRLVSVASEPEEQPDADESETDDSAEAAPKVGRSDGNAAAVLEDPLDEPTEDSDEPTKDSDEPTKDSDEPTKDSDEPTKDSDEPTDDAPKRKLPSYLRVVK